MSQESLNDTVYTLNLINTMKIRELPDTNICMCRVILPMFYYFSSNKTTKAGACAAELAKTKSNLPIETVNGDHFLIVDLQLFHFKCKINR